MLRTTIRRSRAAASALALLATIAASGPASAQDFETYYEGMGFDQLGTWTCHALAAMPNAPNACLYSEGRTTLGMVFVLGLILVIASVVWRRAFLRRSL